MKTLKEVEKIVGLKRRAIQEYEKAELARKPEVNGKCLLYDDRSIDRLWQLRFYQELGYNMTDIKKIEQASTYDGKRELDRVIEELEKKRESLDNAISIARAMRETGMDFNELRSLTLRDAEIKPDDVLGILGMFSEIFVSDVDAEMYEDILEEKDIDRIFMLLDKVNECYDLQLKYDDRTTYDYISKLHCVMKKLCAESVFLFEGLILCFLSASEMEEELGKTRYRYLQSSVRSYCKKNEDNPYDRILVEATDMIEKLARKKYTANSKEVQNEVGRLHDFFGGIGIFTEEGKLRIVKKIGEFYGSKAAKKAMDGGRERGISWFFSRAIEIYCENLK